MYVEYDVVRPDDYDILSSDVEQDELVALVEQQQEILTAIRDDLHLVMVFVLVTFCWSGLRAWRKNFVRGCK